MSFKFSDHKGDSWEKKMFAGEVPRMTIWDWAALHPGKSVLIVIGGMVVWYLVSKGIMWLVFR